MIKLLLTLILSFVSIAAMAESVSFSPVGCEYKVTFPNRPEIKDIYVPEVGFSSPEAELIDEQVGYFLRAFCVPITKEVDKKNMLLKKLTSYSAQNGLVSAGIKTNNTNKGVFARLRGSKKIQNTIWFTYEFDCYAGLTSLICVTAGGPATIYPNNEVLKFQDSIRR